MKLVAYTGPLVVPYAPMRSEEHHKAAAWLDLQAWLRWRKLGGTAARTLDTYERILAKLLITFPDREFAEFTDWDLAEVLETFPSRSRHINKAAMSSWFKWGYQHRRIPANPVDLLPSMRYTPTRIVEIFSRTESAALCALPAPDGQLMSLMFGTGMRGGEARALTGKRLDMERRQVIIREGAKGSRDRAVAMLQPVAQAAADLLLMEGIDPNDFVWYTRSGGSKNRVQRKTMMSTSSWQWWWAKCCKTADVRPLKPHTTRHTFATRMHEAGYPLEEIQVLLGHASIETTRDTYVHTDMTRIGAKMAVEAYVL